MCRIARQQQEVLWQNVHLSEEEISLLMDVQNIRDIHLTWTKV